MNGEELERELILSEEGYEMKQYRQKAAHGDIEAMMNLAWCLFYPENGELRTGSGFAPMKSGGPDYCKRDAKEGLFWFHKVATCECQPDFSYQHLVFDAAAFLGYLHHKGEFGFIKSLESAEEWYKKAVAAHQPGNLWTSVVFHRLKYDNDSLAPDLRVLVGDLLVDINDRDRIADALQWYQNAADDGVTEALNRLAWLYLKGELVDKNNELANQFLAKSMATGDMVAKKLVEEIVKKSPKTSYDVLLGFNNEEISKRGKSKGVEKDNHKNNKKGFFARLFS